MKAAAFLGAAALLAAGDAAAYVCTVIPSGASVFWEGREVPFTIHSTCSADVPVEDCQAAIRRSYQTWTDVDCSDFSFTDQGTSDDARVGYNWRSPADNRNLVVFREGKADNPLDAWVHQKGALAITTLTFNSRTGRILDADIEMNGAPNGTREFRFGVCPDQGSCTAIDIQNTVTHEAGHVVGLDHPDPATPGAAETTMYASAPPGETRKRHLSQDDINGICAIYPAGAATVQCVPAPVDPNPVPKFRQVRTCEDTPTSPCNTGCPVATPLLPGLGVVLFLKGMKRRGLPRL